MLDTPSSARVILNFFVLGVLLANSLSEDATLTFIFIKKRDILD